MVEVKNLSLDYVEEHILDGISLSVAEGECVLFTGKSGSGENSIIVTDTIIKLNQGLKASTKFLNKMILI